MLLGFDFWNVCSIKFSSSEKMESFWLCFVFSVLRNLSLWQLTHRVSNGQNHATFLFSQLFLRESRNLLVDGKIKFKKHVTTYQFPNFEARINVYLVTMYVLHLAVISAHKSEIRPSHMYMGKCSFIRLNIWWATVLLI